MPIDLQALLPLLQCPRSQSPLILEGDAFVCTDAGCRLRFAIQDEIPNLICDDATQMSTEEWEAVLSRHQNSAESGSSGE